MVWKINKKLILTGAAVLLLFLMSGGAFYWYKTNKVLSAQAAAEKAINFINDNFLKTGDNKAELFEATKEKAVFKFRFKIGENEYTAYASKDGKYLFPEGYDMAVPLEGGQ